MDGKEQSLEVEEVRLVTIDSPREFLELETMKDGKFRLVISKPLLGKFS